jgi:putative membrane protein
MGTIILVIIIAVVVTLFSVQNAMPVSISFLVWRFDASLAIVALLLFLAGMVTGTVVLFWIRLRKSMKKKRLGTNEETGQKAGLE